MNSRLLPVFISFVLIVFCSMTMALAVLAKSKKVSLVGLKKVCVVTESLDPVYRKTEIDRKLLTLKIRRKLSDAGFSISSRQEYRTSGFKIPILSIKIETTSTVSGQLTNCINIKLIDMAELSRIPDKTVAVTSWSAHKVVNISKSKPKEVVSHTLSLIDKFITSSRQANQTNAR